MSATPLATRRCEACTPGSLRVTDDELPGLLEQLRGWMIVEGILERTFLFKNYHQTMAFVNAVAWIAHQQDHHPTIEFGYKTCRVRYKTHAIDALSINDFICAAKIDALLDG